MTLKLGISHCFACPSMPAKFQKSAMTQSGTVIWSFSPSSNKTNKIQVTDAGCVLSSPQLLPPCTWTYYLHWTRWHGLRTWKGAAVRVSQQHELTLWCYQRISESEALVCLAPNPQGSKTPYPWRLIVHDGFCTQSGTHLDGHWTFEWFWGCPLEAVHSSLTSDNVHLASVTEASRNTVGIEIMSQRVGAWPSSGLNINHPSIRWASFYTMLITRHMNTEFLQMRSNTPQGLKATSGLTTTTWYFLASMSYLCKEHACHWCPW